MNRFHPKVVVVGYDHSEASRTAWKHAASLADGFAAELHVVYVEPWQVGVDLMPPPDLTPERVKRIQARIAKVVGAKAEIAILHGDPAERILSYARRRRADLIVVGTNGRTGLKRALLGSVAEAVIRAATVPVLAARGPVRPVRSILAPVNFTSYSEQGLGLAAEAAVALGAELTALHVTEDPIWSGNLHFRLDRMLSHLPPEVRKVSRARPEVRLGEAAAGILNARRGHDWIVMVAHEKSMLKDAFFGTTLEQVLRRSTVPVLSMPFAARETAVRVPGRAVSASGR